MYQQQHDENAASLEIADGLLDLDPICELPPLALPLTEQPGEPSSCTEAPMSLPVHSPSLGRNRNSSEIFDEPHEPEEAQQLTDSAGSPPALAVAPRPAVLVSKEGVELEVSDVSPSAAISELVDAAWGASSTPQQHGIVRVYMPFSTASVRRAAAMIQTSAEAAAQSRRIAASRKRKSRGETAHQHPSGGRACLAPAAAVAKRQYTAAKVLPPHPAQPQRAAAAYWPAYGAGKIGCGHHHPLRPEVWALPVP